MTQEEIQKIKETAYSLGRRAALTWELSSILAELGYGDEEFTKERLILERESAIATLRLACEDFGDNEWNENLHLSDVIDKHLIKHLHGK